MGEVSPLGGGATSPTGTPPVGRELLAAQGYAWDVASLHRSPPFFPTQPPKRRPRRAALAVALVALAAPLGLAACGSSGPPTPSDPVLAQGQQVYTARCASCHGVSGGGGIAPALAGRMIERFPDPADQVALIAGGVPGTSMRAFEDVLSPEEIEAVVRYTRESLTD